MEKYFSVTENIYTGQDYTQLPHTFLKLFKIRQNATITIIIFSVMFQNAPANPHIFLEKSVPPPWGVDTETDP